jgi:hypothetical protein
MVEYTDRGGLTAADCARYAGFPAVAEYLESYARGTDSSSSPDNSDAAPAATAGHASPDPPSTELSSGMHEVQPVAGARGTVERERVPPPPNNSEQEVSTEPSQVESSERTSAGAAAAVGDGGGGGAHDNDNDNSNYDNDGGSVASFHIDDDDEDDDDDDSDMPGLAPKIDVRKAFAAHQQQETSTVTASAPTTTATTTVASTSGGRTALVSGSLDYSEESSETTLDAEGSHEVRHRKCLISTPSSCAAAGRSFDFHC